MYCLIPTIQNEKNNLITSEVCMEIKPVVDVIKLFLEEVWKI